MTDEATSEVLANRIVSFVKAGSGQISGTTAYAVANDFLEAVAFIRELDDVAYQRDTDTVRVRIKEFLTKKGLQK